MSVFLRDQFGTSVCVIMFNYGSGLHRNFIPDNLVEAFFRKVETNYEEQVVRGWEMHPIRYRKGGINS